MPIVAEDKDKAKKSFRFNNVFFFLRFYTIETIQASGKMTDKSVSELKSPVLQASTIELQFEFDK